MPILIDSLRPREECLKDIQHKNCTINVKIHAPDEPDNPGEVFFDREVGADFVLLPSSDDAWAKRKGLVPTDPALLGTLQHSINLFRFFDYLQSPAELRSAIETVVDFASVGEIEKPDEVQKAGSSRMIRTLFSLTSEQKLHLARQLEDLSDNNSKLKLDRGTLDRVLVMWEILEFDRTVSQPILVSHNDRAFQESLPKAFEMVMNYLYTGEAPFQKVTEVLKALTLDLAQLPLPAQNTPVPDGIYIALESKPDNLYRTLSKALKGLNQNPPFLTSPGAQSRLAILERWLEQPARSRELNYALLSPAQALRFSIEDELQNPKNVHKLVELVKPWIESPQFSTDWLEENGHLGEIIQSIFSGIEVRENKPGILSLDSEKFRQIPWNLGQLVEAHSIQEREFVAGTLATLFYLFGNPPKASVQWNIYWKGEIKNRNIELNPEQVTILQDIYQSLQDKLDSSLTHTEITLPITEGVVCATGLGILGWGIGTMNSPKDINEPLIAGSTIAGAGCTALLTHYSIPSQNAYISDSVGAAVGATIGAGVPLLVKYLQPATNRNPSGGILSLPPAGNGDPAKPGSIDEPDPGNKPAPNTKPDPDTKPDPIDPSGKNPTQEFGP